MASGLSSRVGRLVLMMALFLIVATSLFLALGGFAATGYAGEGIANPILQALLQRTPTPVPTPVGAACGVRMAQAVTLATDTVGVELSNEGADATIRAITVAWPADNGDLEDIQLGTRSVWAGAETGGAATVFPDRSEVLPTIKTGEQTVLTLQFSKRTVTGRYIVLVHFDKSCYTLFDSSQTAATDRFCFVTFDRFFTDEQQAVLMVRNTTLEPVSLKRLLIFWSSRHAGITSVRLEDGENLISEPARNAPLDVQLPDEAQRTIQPDDSIKLSLMFDSVAPLANYTIALQTDRCQSVFSNAVAPSTCPVRQEGDLQVVGQMAGVVLQNFGEESQPIDRMWLTFPASNSALVDVTLDDVSIVDQSSGLFPKTSSPASMTTGVDLLPGVDLPPNKRSTLSFVFAQDAAPQHYTLELNLADECRVLTTTRTGDSESCQVELDQETPLWTDGNQVRTRVHNVGEDQAELQAIQLDWAPQFNGALTRVVLGGEPFWTGHRSEGTATVSQNTDRVVPAIASGESMDLELTFEDEAVPGPYIVRLNFAEGCQLSYATQDDLSMPTPIDAGGTIEQLPANAFNGIWQIRSGSQVLAVHVTPQTTVESQGLTPLVGDFIHARMLPIGDNEYLATYIRVIPNAVESVELNAVIEEVDSQDPPGYIVVQGIRVEIMQDTVVTGKLKEDWIAHVTGRRRPNGVVLATSIQTEEPPEPGGRRVDFEGVVERWEDLSSGESLWIVSQLRVIVNRNTTIYHGIEPGQRPDVGAPVQVAGNMVSADTVYAIEVWYGPGTDLQEFSGIIRGLPDETSDDPLNGVWIIQHNDLDGACDPSATSPGEACVEVLVTASTFIDMSETSPAVGRLVQVTARENPDGSLEAVRIKILTDD